MRWQAQEIGAESRDALPGLASRHDLVRSVQTPEFAGITFHEVLAKSALNHVPGSPSALPFGWTINPYRGCSHACRMCFARKTHEYLDFDSGRDFDTQIVVKTNIVEVLARELSRPGWGRHPVALGTNTDPYQRAEGRYRLMPGIIAALADSGTPFSILTKGTLLRRDLPVLQDAARRVNVELAVTIDLFDPALRASIEPGAPSAEARLGTVRAIREAGFDPAVFLMPVFPYLTDSVAQLDDALACIAGAGAGSVAYSALHLRPGAREWFWSWLERERPDLVPGYRRVFGTGSYADRDYRAWLGRRIRPLLRRHGLERPPRLDPATGVPRAGVPGQGADAEPMALAAAGLQPTLF
jgi:DNA repair photolyase